MLYLTFKLFYTRSAPTVTSNMKIVVSKSSHTEKVMIIESSSQFWYDFLRRKRSSIGAPKKIK